MDLPSGYRSRDSRNGTLKPNVNEDDEPKSRAVAGHNCAQTTCDTVEAPLSIAKVSPCSAHGSYTRYLSPSFTSSLLIKSAGINSGHAEQHRLYS